MRDCIVELATVSQLQLPVCRLDFVTALQLEFSLFRSTVTLQADTAGAPFLCQAIGTVTIPPMFTPANYQS